ncbi:MAG TPA: DUF5063 domain-containing protein, partial [Paludibacteraceae bacterium]|nr:DUF5063 domain-containing protein [Paludibacteraceae bacterium]
YQLADVDIMNDALVTCLVTFAEHWGQKLLNAMRALHALKYTEENKLEKEIDEEKDTHKISRDSFLDFQRKTE